MRSRFPLTFPIFPIPLASSLSKAPQSHLQWQYLVLGPITLPCIAVGVW